MVRQLARFAAALRAGGVRVGLGDEVDATTTLTLIDLLDRAEVHRALRIAFKIPREVVRVAELPRTASGKVRKHVLLQGG